MPPPWASHGIALGALNGNSMDVLYGQCIVISPWAVFGIALGFLKGECHGSVLWLAHWPCAQVHSMDLQWCFSMGIPRQCAMGNSVGCHPWASHGIALGALNGNSMDVLYGQCIRVFPWAFFGIALGFLIGGCHGSVLWLAHWPFAQVHSMDLQWCFSMGIPRQCAMGNSVGWHPWASHGIALGLLFVYSVECFYGDLIGHSPRPFHGIALGLLFGMPMESFYG